MANRKVHNIHKDLFYWVRRSKIITLPNFYIGRYEADLMSIDDKKDLIIEYEVKITRQDFKCDFLKAHYSASGSIVYKHELIKQGNRCHRFYFVMPENMVLVDEVPTYAGLIYQTEFGGFKTVKRAPVIGTFPLSYSFYKDIAISAAYREGNIRHKYKYLNGKV